MTQSSEFRWARRQRNGNISEASSDVCAGVVGGLSAKPGPLGCREGEKNPFCLHPHGFFGRTLEVKSTKDRLTKEKQTRAHMQHTHGRNSGMSNSNGELEFGAL